jgi:hypothetical protein
MPRNHRAYVRGLHKRAGIGVIGIWLLNSGIIVLLYAYCVTSFPSLDIIKHMLFSTNIYYSK